MWELVYKESWAPKNWYFWTVVLGKTHESPLDCKESPLDCKEIQPVHPKGNQSWIFIGRTDAEAATIILWALMQSSDSFEKTLILGKTEGRRRRGWQSMRWLDGITDSMYEFEQIPGDSKGQGSLVWCSPWGCKESNTTKRLNRRSWHPVPSFYGK